MLLYLPYLNGTATNTPCLFPLIFLNTSFSLVFGWDQRTSPPLNRETHGLVPCRRPVKAKESAGLS